MRVQVEPNDLGNLKDSMEHYLQDAAEPDFVEVLAALLLRLLESSAAKCLAACTMTAEACRHGAVLHRSQHASC